MKNATEAPVKLAVKKLLDQYKAQWFMPIGGAYGRAGVSDFIVCYKGRYAAIETKSATGKPTPLQVKFLKEIETAGGRGFIVRDTESLQEVERWLRSIIG